MFTRLITDYGIVFVLLALGAILTVVTVEKRAPSGAAAAQQIADAVVAQTPAGATIVILAGSGADDNVFAATIEKRVGATGRQVTRVNGQPVDAVQTLQKLAADKVRIDAIAMTSEVGNWPIFEHFDAKYPLSAGASRLQPTASYRSSFLSAANLLNIANRIAVIAIMAIGMTMVIIAGGIDLSVGSLLALSAVLAAMLIRLAAGGTDASALGMIACCAAGIAACALIGLGTGVLVTTFQVPPFIVTLGVMLIARGLAGKLAGGQSEFAVPDSFTWLGRESSLVLLPNAVVLMLLLYVAAHLVMAQTVVGRYIYAVGGNREAARLSGVPVQRVLVGVYVVSAALAGLGGVILASQLKSGSPTYGIMYELHVIAAVVVGGTSLSGGEGRVFGTLVGAFLIAVIENGMNLLGLSSYDQQMVLGGVIVLAVLFDRLKQAGWLRWRQA